MRRMQKRDAQPLSKDSLLDLLHGDVKNLCEKVKHQRKAEIAENIKQKSQPGVDQYVQFKSLADELRIAAGEMTDSIPEETKETSKEQPKQKEKVNYNLIVEREVSAQPWLTLL